MKTLPTLAAAALVTLMPCAQAHDDPDAPPKGSATHSLLVVGDELETAGAALSEAQHRLSVALGGEAGEPPRLARAVASLHESWLAYRNADCELAGALTGAGGAWPAVHGITCRIDHLTQRTEVLDSATSCLQALPLDSYDFERLECLQALVDWEMQGN